MPRLLERKSELAAIRSVIRRGGALVIEGQAGIGKTAILEAACSAANRQRRPVLRARGSELESGFAFGLACQLFERPCNAATAEERAAWFRGTASPARQLLVRDTTGRSRTDTSFAILRGLYWLTVNLAASRPVLIAIDDAHWGDDASLRWLAYLARRLDGIEAALIVSLRPEEPRSQGRALLSMRTAANATVRPALLSQQAVATLARDVLGSAADGEIGAGIHRATGGNPFYVWELLRALRHADVAAGAGALDQAISRGGLDGIARQLAARLRSLDPLILRLAQAFAILGDGCELRHAARIAHMQMSHAASLAAELVRLDVLGHDRPPRFIHPIVQHAVAQTLSSAEEEAAHRAASGLLHAEGSPPARIAAHLTRLRAAADPWVVDRLREAARAALENGAPAAAADLLERALAEPPPAAQRVEILREAGWAHLQAGRAAACDCLEQASALAGAETEAEIASELANAYATLFRWTDAVRVLERALNWPGRVDRSIAADLEGQLAAIGLQDARVAPRALRAMKRLSRRRRLPMAPAVSLALGQGMVAILSGQPADDAARALERALAGADALADNWDLRAALWWCLITAERFEAVEDTLKPLREQVDRSGGSRGLVAVYSTLGLLKFRLGALPEADAAARIALQVVQEGDFAPGLPFAATVLADVAVASGELSEAEALLDLLPHGSLPAGVGTALIPAGRGRLLLAQGRASEALQQFEDCIALWRSVVWGMEMRDVGYLHARSGAARALLALGEPRRALELAEAELADVRRFAGRRALGVALRTAGLARGGKDGLRMLEDSVSVLNHSPAALERAHSLIEWGSAQRRAGQRQDALRVLSEGLDAAARCGARPLIARAREELRIAGARPRRDWTSGVEALTPSELRIVRLAREGQSNRQIAQRLYLSIKTVEGHLARAYDKLDIATRGDIDRVFAPEKARVSTL
ncbi:MAG: AAA family ATPase [Acetobacteraceae bacterium]|nr:AAA family ATPase [Acetobacteraceae bacterium]